MSKQVTAKRTQRAIVGRDAWVYELSAPVYYEQRGEKLSTDYVTVLTFWNDDVGKPSVVIYPSDESGSILSYNELPGSHVGDADHEKAIREAGWTLDPKSIKRTQPSAEELRDCVGIHTHAPVNVPEVVRSAGTGAPSNPATWQLNEASARRFADVRAMLLDGLQAHGWSVARNLKVPHATSPDGQTRLWFKTQAIYMNDVGTDPRQFANAHSLAYDMREYQSVDELLAGIKTDIDRDPNEESMFEARAGRRTRAPMWNGTLTQLGAYEIATDPYHVGQRVEVNLGSSKNPQWVPAEVVTVGSPDEKRPEDRGRVWVKLPAGYETDLYSGDFLRPEGSAVPHREDEAHEDTVPVIYEDGAREHVQTTVVGEPGPKGDCLPWVRVTRDPERYEACLAQAQKIGPIDNAKKIYELLAPTLSKEDQEVLMVVLVDVRRQLRGVAEVHRGQRSSVGVSVADVLRVVITTGAEGFVLSHGHPSGKSSPSKADVELTKQIAAATKPYGKSIAFIGHVVIGTGEYSEISASGEVSKVVKIKG